MLKKYLPFILLIAAALFYFWVKSHQRGAATIIHAGAAGNVPDNNLLNRNAENISYSKHARCRMDCRHIDESEIKEILKSGTINFNKIEENARGKSYPLEGITHDGQHVRIVFAPQEQQLVVVTVIDLDKEWPCHCR